MYVDALADHQKNVIKVVERHQDGSRIYTNYPARYLFYYRNPRGTFKDIFGQPLSVSEFKSQKAFLSERKKQAARGTLYESDHNVVFRCLADNYSDADVPDLNKVFFDIEVDFNKDFGFADPSDPFNRVTAIAVHMSWVGKTVCLVNKPDSMSQEEAEKIVAELNNEVDEEILLLATERDLLLSFLDLIEDGDIMSGWNSEGFDIPYMVNRVGRVLGKDYTRKFCLWDKHPTRREFEKFGSTSETYDLHGRIHADYLELYRKYTYHEMHSYSLDAIAEYELGETKVQYEGTLDQLYHNDFDKFIRYNIQDTNILVRLDNKLQYIDQANLIAHANTVLIPTTMGAVAQIDQAIINEAHRLGYKVPDKSRSNMGRTDAAGAYVAQPVKGLHRFIGSIDLNSLYPSIIRSCNMSPETLAGQLRQTYTDEHIGKFEKLVDAWEGMFSCIEYELVMKRDREHMITIDFEKTHVSENPVLQELQQLGSFEATGAEIYSLIFESGQPWVLTSNGTILNLEHTGVIPSLLERWYSERKELQAKKKFFSQVNDGEIHVPERLQGDYKKNDNHVETKPLLQLDPKQLNEIFKTGSGEELNKYIEQHNATIKDGAIAAKDQAELKDAIGYWDKRQLVKKILLNSAYGALLNAGSKFFDQRLGQSTTLTGRSIAKHMAAQVNKEFTGVYDHVGEAIIYGDTDSAYFSAANIIEKVDPNFKLTKDTVQELYDDITEKANQTFPDYMRQAHNVDRERGKIIAAGREILGTTGLFIKKKRYAVMVYDDEGSRKDVGGKPGKVKAMGLDLKRSDTPKFMQEFLKQVLEMVLVETPRQEILDKIRDFRKEFRNMPGWEQGSPKRVNSLKYYYNQEYSVDKEGNETFKGKARIPGHVRAAINYNRLRALHNDQYSMPITDGMKTVVCRLLDNPYQITSIAIPIDEPRIPSWFKELPFDTKTMEDIVINKKIENLLGVLNWDLKQTEDTEIFRDLFQPG